MNRYGYAVYVEADGSANIKIILANGQAAETQLPETTPAEDLIHAVAIDYSAYRKEIQKLRKEHPLFAEQTDIAESDLEDLVSIALTLPEMIRETDLVGYFVVVGLLHQALQKEDDGSASFLLHAGMELIHALEEPIRTQIMLRNIFEISFDGMERATQQERYAKLAQTYPAAVRQYYHSQWMEQPQEAALPLSSQRLEYMVGSTRELRLLELSLYFRQAQRITRYAYCWDYFMPKTRKETLYCNRVWGAKTCKELGPNLKRGLGPELDETLRVYEALRRRKAAQMERYENAVPTQRNNLIKMDFYMFADWSDMARAARMAYLRKELTSEAFLRKIDTNQELSSYHVAPPKENSPSISQELRERDIHFDPEQHYADMMVLDLGTESPQWELRTAAQQKKQDSQGHESLREKYGKD